MDSTIRKKIAIDMAMVYIDDTRTKIGKLKKFDGVDVSFAFSNEFETENHQYVMPDYICIDDIDLPLDVRILKQRIGEDEMVNWISGFKQKRKVPYEKYPYIMLSYRTIVGPYPFQSRKYWKWLPKIMIRHDGALLDCDSDRWELNGPYYYGHGSTIDRDKYKMSLWYPPEWEPKWINGGANFTTYDDDEKGFVNQSAKDQILKEALEHSMNMNMAISIAFTNHFIWYARIFGRNGLSVRVPIEPQSAKDLFKDRLKPEDKLRRPMLRNWIRHHSRRIVRKDGSDNEIEIMRHLRGNLEFDWRGNHVAIEPSGHAISQLKRQKELKA